MSGNKYKQRKIQVCKLLRKSRGESCQYHLVEQRIRHFLKKFILLPKAALPLPPKCLHVFSVVCVCPWNGSTFFAAGAGREGGRICAQKLKTDCATNKSDF